MECSDSIESLEFLSELKKFSLDSKLTVAQRYSSRIADMAEVSLNKILAQNITPFEIEVYTLYSIVFNDESITDEITPEAFAKIITGIRNYRSDVWKKNTSTGEFANAFMMISGLTQFATQGPFIFKLFRASYFFNFRNEEVDIKTVFIEKFGAKYDEFEKFAFLVYLGLSLEFQNLVGKEICQRCLSLAFSNKAVMDALSITNEQFIEELKNIYGDDINKYYYGLKIQYLFPIVSGSKCHYIPSPYLIVNAVSESLVNRLTEGNQKLRALFGKEVIESYLHKIYQTVPNLTWISREFVYANGEKRTPDLLVEENGICIMYDTKAKSPGLKLRTFEEAEIESEINIYAKNILQIYHRICDFMNGEFSMQSSFERDQVYGVSVVLEDSFISREMIYKRVFQMLAEELGEEHPDENEYIHSHIKVLSLRQIESLVLRSRGLSNVLVNHSKEKDKWNDYEINTDDSDGETPEILKCHTERLFGVIASLG